MLDRTMPITWDKGIETASETFAHKRFSLCGNNSFHFVAECLNNIYPTAPKKYTARNVAKAMFTKSHYVRYPIS
jgi:hypothetical protein